MSSRERQAEHDRFGGILAVLGLADHAEEVASVSYRDETEQVGQDYGPTREYRRLGTHFTVTFHNGGYAERFIPADELDRWLAEGGG